MAVSKVILNGQTLIDVTEDTVASNNLLQGNQATGADGVTVSGGVTKKAAQTYTPGTTDQTIASGQYLNGVQTIKGDANLIPANIASGVSIFGVQGEHKGSEENKKRIIFIDYDGTVVDSYTESEFSELQALPANPSHTGLVAQGWNWTLAQIQNYLLNYPEGDIVVGQSYVTESGATEIDVELTEDTLEPWLLVGSNGNFSIDWGDGTERSSVSGSSITTMIGTHHTYASAGNYTISIIPKGIVNIRFSYSGETSCILCDVNSSASKSLKYINTIKHVRVGTGMPTIGAAAFSKCSNLISVTIPSSVTSITSRAFQYCRRLTSLTLPNTSNSSMQPYVFQFCENLVSLSIPSTMRTIYNYACYYCTSLSLLTIPSELTSLGQSAFNNCSKLSSIVIPSGVQSVSSSAFNGCSELASLYISSGVNSILESAFSGCKNLSSLTIPSSVTSFGNSAFSSCSKLNSVTIASSSLAAGSYAFRNCTNLTSIIMPSSMSGIGFYMFSGCQNLVSLTLPASITSIGEYAFSSCWSLSSITIPSGVTSIGGSAFADCWNLNSLVIPSSVTTISSNAFSYCYSMVEYHFESETPPSLGTSAFDKIQNGCIIYVPKGSLEAYRTAINWSTYASRIQEEPD